MIAFLRKLAQVLRRIQREPRNQDNEVVFDKWYVYRKFGWYSLLSIVIFLVLVALGGHAYGVLNKFFAGSFEEATSLTSAVASVFQGTFGIAASLASTVATVYFASLAYELARASAAYSRREQVHNLDELAVRMVPKVKTFQIEFNKLMHKLLAHEVSQQYRDAAIVFALMNVASEDLAWHRKPWESPNPQSAIDNYGALIIERMKRIALFAHETWVDSNSHDELDADGNKVTIHYPESSPMRDIIKALDAYAGNDPCSIPGYSIHEPELQAESKRITDIQFSLLRLCKKVYEDVDTNRLFMNRSLRQLLESFDIDGEDNTFDDGRFKLSQNRVVASSYATLSMSSNEVEADSRKDGVVGLLQLSYLMGPVGSRAYLGGDYGSEYWSTHFLDVIGHTADALLIDPKSAADALNLKLQHYIPGSPDYMPAILETFLNSTIFIRHKHVIDGSRDLGKTLHERLNSKHGIDASKSTIDENGAQKESLLLCKLSYGLLKLSYSKHADTIGKLCGWGQARSEPDGLR